MDFLFHIFLYSKKLACCEDEVVAKWIKEDVDS